MMMRILIALVAVTSAAHADPLSVEVKPATLTWKPKKHVDVALRVVNTSKTKQSITAWLCSWFQNVKSSDPELIFEPWSCDKNYEKKFDLEPGKAWEQKLDMFATDTAKAGAHKLKIGFTPSGGTTTWSPEVAITVER